MQTWEYTTAKTFEVRDNPKTFKFRTFWSKTEYSSFDELANELGSKGWEMVGVAAIETHATFIQINNLECTNMISYYFKRPVEKENPKP